MANSIVSVIEQLGEDYDINNLDIITIDTLKNCMGIGTHEPMARLDINNKNSIKDLLINDLEINGKELQIKHKNDISYILIPKLDVSDLSSLNIITSNINNKIEFKNDLICMKSDISFEDNITLTAKSINATSINTDSINTDYATITSDDRLKHNEINIENAIDIIRRLKPVKYQKTNILLSENYMGNLNIDYIDEAGLIAQDIEKIEDLKFTVIKGDENKPYKLKYNNIFVYSLQAIKELDNSLNNIQTDINKIQNYTDNFKDLMFLKDISDKADIITNQYNTIQVLINKINNLTNRINILESTFNK